MGIAERLKDVIDKKGITPYIVSRDSGINESILSRILSGKTKKPQDETIKMLANYLRISHIWLKSGNGEMLQIDESVVSEIKNYLIPLLPISAQAGKLTDFTIAVKKEDCEKIISPINDVDFAITISGDSMAPELSNGSQILIKKINEKAFIEWGKVYVLDTCNGTVIKRLAPSDKEGFVKCISANPDPAFAPFEVNLKDVYGVYRVLLCMTRK